MNSLEVPPLVAFASLRKQSKLCKDDRTYPSEAFRHLRFLREQEFDLQGMAQRFPEDVYDAIRFLEVEGIPKITSRQFHCFSPRLAQLFYQTLRIVDGKYVWTWDGIDYELSEKMIARALDISLTQPSWSRAEPYDAAILRNMQIPRSMMNSGFPTYVKLLDRILYANAWQRGDSHVRHGELLTAVQNIIHGHWISPASLIFKSMISLLNGVFQGGDVKRLRFPLTIEAIRRLVGHPIIDDEVMEAGITVCANDWITNFYEDPWYSPVATYGDITIDPGTIDETDADLHDAIEEEDDPVEYIHRRTIDCIFDLIKTIDKKVDALTTCVDGRLGEQNPME